MRCGPDNVRTVTERVVGSEGAEQDAARRAIALIDLTDLGDRANEAGILELCARAAEHGTAAVCVWPDFVGTAADALAGATVRIATVVNFPTGDERAHATRVLTERALADGAHEIDVVLPYRAWLGGDLGRAGDVIDVVVTSAHEAGAVVKVILETGALPDRRSIAGAARFALDRGTDFIKTSTGKIGRSATPDAVEVMLAEIKASGRPVGLKPSGGIRTAADAARYLAIADAVMGPDWATPSTFRFGASGLLEALLAVIRRPSDVDAVSADGDEAY